MKKALIVFYIIILLLLTFFSYAFIDSNLIYYSAVNTGFATQNRVITTIVYGLLVVLLFIFYISLLLLIKKKELEFKDIKFLIGVTCIILLFSYPAMLSYDIFNYIATAKVLFFYHENPYIIMPIEFIGDPLLLFTHAANKLALYGPGWITLTGIPHFLGFGNFIVALMNFKLLSLVFYIFAVWNIWLLSKNIQSVSLFAFNPLVIIETLISSHNDIVMMSLALFSFFLIKRRRFIWAICFFIASVLIKYATLFLLPIFIFLMWRSYYHKEIDWKKIYYFSFFAMLIIFFLSPIREEMYPWYAVWFLPFVFLMLERKILLYCSLAFSFGLLLRYTPFMYSGNHFGITPLLKVVLASFPVVGVAFIVLMKKFKTN